MFLWGLSFSDETTEGRTIPRQNHGTPHNEGRVSDYLNRWSSYSRIYSLEGVLYLFLQDISPKRSALYHLNLNNQQKKRLLLLGLYLVIHSCRNVSYVPKSMNLLSVNVELQFVGPFLVKFVQMSESLYLMQYWPLSSGFWDSAYPVFHLLW